MGRSGTAEAFGIGKGRTSTYITSRRSKGALKVRVYRRKETADTMPPPVALCRRGRRLDGRIEGRVAA